MYVFASAAISLDGCLDDAGSERLILSSPEDFAEVYRLRAEFDAILVGAQTIRSDNPSLVTIDDQLKTRRLRDGRPIDPVKVTLTRTGQLDPAARFFARGEGRKVVLCTPEGMETARRRLGPVATIVEIGEQVSAASICERLEALGIESLFLEGGSEVLTLFIGSGTVNRFRLAIAPLIVGEPTAPRLVRSAPFPRDVAGRMRVENVEQFGSIIAVTYAMGTGT